MFLNVVLNGLKQITFDVCRICDVGDGKVIMSNLNFYAYSIVFRATWLPCPSKTNKCRLVKDTLPKTNFLKKVKNFVKKEEII